MKQLTINIPDYCYNAFMEYFKNIPEASLVNESSFVLSGEMIDLLDKRHDTPSTAYISMEESNKRLKGIF